MADIINLRTVRKQKSRVEKDAQASQNRVIFGRTKAEKQKAEAEQRLAEKHIDGHKRDE